MQLENYCPDCLSGFTGCLAFDHIKTPMDLIDIVQAEMKKLLTKNKLELAIQMEDIIRNLLLLDEAKDRGTAVEELVHDCAKYKNLIDELEKRREKQLASKSMKIRTSYKRQSKEGGLEGTIGLISSHKLHNNKLTFQVQLLDLCTEVQTSWEEVKKYPQLMDDYLKQLAKTKSRKLKFLKKKWQDEQSKL